MTPAKFDVVTVLFVSVVIGLSCWAASCDECPESWRGRIHVTRFRGDRVEECDGKKWRPLVFRDDGTALRVGVGPAVDGGRW